MLNAMGSFLGNGKKRKGRWRQNEGNKGNCVTMQLNSSNEVRHQFQWKQYHYMSQAACFSYHARAGGDY